MLKLNLNPYLETTKKPRAVKRHITNPNVEKNITMICEIDINGNYFATNEKGDIHYPITKESYKVPCSKFYAIELYKGKRLERKTLKPMVCGVGYIPFAPGIGITGDIITLEDKTKVFDFKKLTDIDSEKAKECFLFYKNNYDEIRINYMLTHND